MARGCCGGPVCACKIVTGGGGITVTGTGTSQDPFTISSSGEGGGGGTPAPGGGTDTTPPGTLIEGFWPAAPTGYALITGNVGVVLDRSDNPVLFAIFGIRFNIGGEAADEFRLPAGGGKTTVIRDASQVEFDVIGESGGTKTVTLTEEQLAVHYHPQIVTVPTAGGPAIRSDYNADGPAGPYLQGYTTGPAGGGQPHNNLPPYLVVNAAIRLG